MRSATALVALLLLGGCSNEDKPGADSKPAPAPEAGARVGSPAPGFEVLDDTEANVTLASHKGDKAVLLAFYPKDFTGG